MYSPSLIYVVDDRQLTQQLEASEKCDRRSVYFPSPDRSRDNFLTVVLGMIKVQLRVNNIQHNIILV